MGRGRQLLDLAIDAALYGADHDLADERRGGGEEQLHGRGSRDGGDAVRADRGAENDPSGTGPEAGAAASPLP